jgi:integrase/recombinase XerD
MARVYLRRKEPGKGWRYKAIPTGGGRRPVFEPGAKFHVRYADASGKFVWSHAYGTLEEAQKEAAGLELNEQAVAQGLTLEEYKNRANSNRSTIKKAVETFLAEAAKTKKEKSHAAYKQHLAQFQQILKVRFMDEITKTTLCEFRDSLATKGYEARTQHNRLMTVLSFLKKNKIKTDFSLKDDLPEYEEEPAVPYEPVELNQLFTKMTAEEIIRYKFFLGTAARDKEVTFAAWQDIDFARGIYHIRRKLDVGFTPKKHESRDVKMPTELVETLKERKKKAPHPRWIFVNEEGRPDNHFLRKFKRIALRAGLNCGHCTAPWAGGRYHTKRTDEVSCKTHPVCQHHYLHRLRKTCASNWEASGIPVRTIQYMLGHKSLETTQKYLGIANLDSLTDKIDAAAKR